MQSVTSSDGILQIHSANERGPCASLWLPDRSGPGSLTTWWTCVWRAGQGWMGFRAPWPPVQDPCPE